MTIPTNGTINSSVRAVLGQDLNPGTPANLDANKLILNLAQERKPIPPPETLVLGETKTDHMLVVHYDPVNGWSPPEIKPYGPLSIDPASSCLQYSTNVFEGMKAFIGPDGKARLFRPEKNMERLVNSATRVALPTFDQNALLTLIKRLVFIDKRWIPTNPGYSLYIRPTIIGTRTNLGVRYSDTATLFVILSPGGPFYGNGLNPISLLAVSEAVRAWPGGTGAHKLGLNYGSTFLPQLEAASKGYDQILWLFEADCPNGGKKELRITEAGSMNVFIVVKRSDGNLDLITPVLDGTILPGITRDSTLTLANAHTIGDITLPGIPPAVKIFTHEKPFTMSLLSELYADGKVLEFFGVGTAATVCPISTIGWNDRKFVFPISRSGLGMVGDAILKMLTGIQTGRVVYGGWSVSCD